MRLHGKTALISGAALHPAAIAVLLASGEATYITRSEISIDGGLLAGSVASLG